MNEEQGTTRRRFLGTAAGATGVALAVVAWPAKQAAAAVPEAGHRSQSPLDKRTYVAGRFALDLEGETVGVLSAAEGGNITADVVTEKLGPDHAAHKHLAGTKYEDISMAVGAGMSNSFYSWIAASWLANFQRKSGVVITADQSLNVRKRLEFYEALIRETAFPALDASSKEAALIDVTLTPEQTVLDRAATGQLEVDASAKQKQWTVGNFRLKIDGLDCTKVNKIEALVIKQKLVESQIGEGRDFQKEPGAIEFPNLVVTLPDSSADTWYAWFTDFVINGNNHQEREKNGKIEYLAPNLEVLFTIELKQVGIFKLAPDNAGQSADNIARVRAEMYVERMLFAQGRTIDPNETG